MKKNWFLKSDLTLLLLSLFLSLLTHLFYLSNGFVHNIQSDGTILYCSELQTLGSDADLSVFYGYFLWIPIVVNLLIPKFLKLKIAIVTLSSLFTALIFWGMTSAEMADISLTIMRDKNGILLLWIIVLHCIVPAYLFSTHKERIVFTNEF